MTREKAKQFFTVHTNGQDKFIKVDKRQFDNFIDLIYDSFENKIITDDLDPLKDFVFTNCNECINKVDNHFTETCLGCTRYYGCYFEKKETK